MKIAFVSGFLSAHQQPICDALYNNENVDFRFIAQKPLSDTRKQMGWVESPAQAYELRSYESDDLMDEAMAFVRSCDVLIMGNDQNDAFFDTFMKHGNGIVFRFTERIYKKGRWRALSPVGLALRWHTYYKRDKKRLYVLCASAYAAGDFALLGSYLNKCYKWGYFPPTYTYDIQQVLANKQKASIFWAGRMLDWKHPETMVAIAKHLRDANADFVIRMAGDGPLFDKMRALVDRENLQDHVILLGNLPLEEVRNEMLHSRVFVTTSDYNEGWGAVINEAMNSGCAVVGCQAMGAVRFLIQNGENGFTYAVGNEKDAAVAVETLLQDEAMCCRLGHKAYETITREWNASVAAERLVCLSQKLLSRDKEPPFLTGPGSKAPIFHKET